LVQQIFDNPSSKVVFQQTGSDFTLNPYYMKKFALLFFISFLTTSLFPATLTTEKIEGKYFFKLNGELWFPVIHYYDVNGTGPFLTGDMRSQITTLKDKGYNTLMVPFIKSWANDSKMGELFSITEELGIYVIINYNCIWEYHQWINDHPDWKALTFNNEIDQELDYLPNVRNEDFLAKLNEGLTDIIQYGNTKPSVIAYQLVDSDFWKVVDDAAHTYRNWPTQNKPSKAFISTSIFAYNSENLSFYKQWLQDEGFTPAELGFVSWEDLFMPWNELNAKNMEHWLSWKEFRVFGLSVAALEISYNHAKSLTDKPVGVGFDGGFSAGWADQENAIHQGLSEVVDFGTIFLGWNAPFQDSWRVKSGTKYAPNCPIIGFFDVTTGAYIGFDDQRVYPISQVFTTIPYISGFLMSSGGKVGGGCPTCVKLEDWNDITRSLQKVSEKSLWKYTASKAKVGVLISKPDTYETGINCWGNQDDHYITFAQKGLADAMNRAGIPFTEIWHDQNLSDFDVVVGGYTAPKMIYSGRYTALTPAVVNDFINGGGVYIKGPMPMRNDVKYLYFRDSNSALSTEELYLSGDGWSEITSRDDDLAGTIDVRYLRSAGDAFLHLPFESNSNHYELSLTYYDVDVHGFQLQIETSTGWKDLKMQQTKNAQYWRTLVAVIDKEYMYSATTNGKCRIRIVNNTAVQIPLFRAEWSQLSNTFPQTDTYLPADAIITPVLKKDFITLTTGQKISDVYNLNNSPGYYQRVLSETVKTESEDEILTTTYISGLGGEQPSVVARQNGNGWAIKMGINAPSIFFSSLWQNGSFPGSFDETLNTFIAELLQYKAPDIKAFEVTDSEGNIINNKVECNLAFNVEDPANFVLISQNHTEESLEDFKVTLNTHFLNFNFPELSFPDSAFVFAGNSAVRLGECVRYITLDQGYFYENGIRLVSGEDPTGNDALEFADNKVSIYPNPTTGVLQILLAESFTTDKVKFKVFSLSGQLLISMESTFWSGKHQLNVSALNKGMYLLEIAGQDLSDTHLFTVQ
jgi:hypothetical protein